MAATIDLEKIVGTDEFPNTENDVLGLVETIASQRIMALRSANRLIDATFDYDVENGRVIQEAVIEMAKSYAYDKNAYDRAPSDPTAHVRYFSDYTERQFQTTIRRDDIRKIIANKGEGVEDVIAQILSTLTSGEGHEDFENVRALLLNEYVKDYSSILGGVPKNIKGCIYAARNMYNHLKSDNSDLTQGAGTADAYVSSTPEEDIRVAITESLLNLMDVVELANIFNLQKEELFGVLVVVPDSDLPAAQKYKIVAYDRKAMGRATFTYDFTQEYVPKGRYQNEYLTVSRCYFFNELFKAAALDCTVAAEAAIDGLLSSPFDLDVTVENGTTTELPATIDAGEEVSFTITADSGFDLPVAVDVKNAIVDYDATTGVVKIYNAINDVQVSIICTAQSSAPVIALAPLEQGDILDAEHQGNIVCNINKTKEEVTAIISQLTDGITPSQGGFQRIRFIVGSASSYPQILAFDRYVNNEIVEGSQAIQFRLSGASNFIYLYDSSFANNGWNLSETNILNGQFIIPITTALGNIDEAQSELWNGILIGKLPTE